jgi:hypothetical protein
MAPWFRFLSHKWERSQLTGDNPKVDVDFDATKDFLMPCGTLDSAETKPLGNHKDFQYSRS